MRLLMPHPLAASVHFLSAAESRAWTVEHPTGNPLGGPAYGERAMPVVAIVAAVASFAAGAAIATAAGATLGAMIVGGAMMVGAAMTVVGTISGNQNLVKWGGIISLAGGVGALGLGLAGALTDGAASAAESTTAGLSAGDADQIAANQQVGSAAAATPAVPPTEPTGLMPTEAAANPQLAGTQPPVGPASTPSVTTVNAESLNPTAADSFAPGTSNSFVAPGQNTFTPQVRNPFDPNVPYSSPGDAEQALAQETVRQGGVNGSSSNWWDRSLEFARKNPEVARAGLTAATGLFANAVPRPLNDLERSQANAYNTRAQIDRMRAGLAPGWWYGRAAGG